LAGSRDGLRAIDAPINVSFRLAGAETAAAVVEAFLLAGVAIPAGKGGGAGWGDA